MKRIIFSLLMPVFAISATAQGTEGTFHIVYVDNSRVTVEDGLNDYIFDKLMTQFDTIRAHKKDKFLFFVSDGKNFITTENINSVKKMIDNAMIKNQQRLPDQHFDMLKIRDMVFEKVNDFKGSVSFSAYISENLSSKISEGYSSLLGFFPKELAAISQSKKVSVSVLFPKLTGRVKADALKQALNFYNQQDFSNNVSYSVQSF